ncbi:pilus assembly protein TadG-related protein [Tropicibacter sp. S64]|uniref:pilus assembly protein TadG-related protein n=1 Tax=Tropicibacter sp. S64 TaxID=3415122 RepID=UPI003C7DFD2D
MKRAIPGLDVFRTDEGGNITIFSVFMVMLILIITGASVDIMRQEANRAKMQATLDRAVLAATDLDQMQEPTAVVQDYMAKAGLGTALSTIAVDDGLNYRTVQAKGSLGLQTFFLKMSGLDNLPVQAISTAEEKISNVEISLVLDISGSMDGDRIINMREAARQFIDTVVKPAEEGTGLATVSLVPYNATVSLGETVGAHWTFDSLHDYSRCAIFPDGAFHDTAISPSQTLTRLSHFDIQSSDQNTAAIAMPWCATGDTSAVVVHSADAAILKSRVNALQAGGNTAIDLGVKWGVALLDPAARPVVGALADEGLVPVAAASRPAGYNDPEAIKFVVVMTDGENTSEYDLRSKYKTGMSNVWINDHGNDSPYDDHFSIKVRDYSGTSNDVWFWKRYENSSSSYRYRNSPDGGSNARQMTNQELYARFSTAAVANKFYVKPYYDGYVSYQQYYDVYYAYEELVGGDRADDRLHDICQAAKDEGIVIFSIAFEAPAGGKAALRDCASSASHYFDVQGVEITDTFHAIARQINNLRLIQ